MWGRAVGRLVSREKIRARVALPSHKGRVEEAYGNENALGRSQGAPEGHWTDERLLGLLDPRDRSENVRVYPHTERQPEGGQRRLDLVERPLVQILHVLQFGLGLLDEVADQVHLGVLQRIDGARRQR